MNPDQWKRMDRLFNRLLELPEQERLTALAALDEDTPIKDAVRAMLAADAGDAPTIEEAIRDAAGELPEEHDDGDAAWIGRQVGAFRIIERIARGGMGAVFVAERADDAFAQKVAVKILGSGLMSREARQRFLSERQILADLNHPNIASLIDGGTTTEGVPYLVMEYVDGLRIDQYCDASQLDNRARLALFRKVCAAVQYAHRNLIIHRDIKPSNILVTADGEPKLLDFGVAKLMEPGDLMHTVAVTVGGMSWLTPQTASPEQVRGGTITTASDVYALGVLLYHLMTGGLPFHLTSFQRSEIERIICETEPARPSEAVTSVPARDEIPQPTADEISRARLTSIARIQKQLRGDIDNIVLVAMHKDPNRRYATVQQLSQDVENHLRGWPVVARPDSWRYRAHKFLQRNLAAVTSSVVVLAIVAGLIAFYTQRLANERDVARQERQSAESVAGFMVDIFDAANPMAKSGGPVTAADVLHDAVERIEGELDDQPRLQANLLVAMGNAYRGLGMWPESINLLERSVAVERANFGNAHLELADALAHLGSTKGRRRRDSESVEHYREAMQIYVDLFGPVDTGYVDVLNALGAATRRLGDYEEALGYHAQAEKFASQLDTDPDAQYANVLMSTGITYYYMQRYDDAIEYLLRALDESRRILSPYSQQVFTSLALLANARQGRGDLAQAVARYEELIALELDSIGGDHPLIARAYKNLSTIYRDLGDYQSAEREVGKAIDIHSARFGDGDYETVRARAGLGEIYYEMGRFGDALAILRPARDQMEQATSADGAVTLEIAIQLAECERDAGLGEAARQRYADLEPRARSVFGEKDPRYARVLAGMALLESDAGAAHKAEALSAQAHAIANAAAAPSPTGAQVLTIRGALLLGAGESQTVVEMLRESLQQHERLLGAGHWRTAVTRSALGDAIRRNGDRERGAAMMRQAIEELEITRPSSDRYLRDARQRLAT